MTAEKPPKNETPREARPPEKCVVIRCTVCGAYTQNTGFCKSPCDSVPVLDADPEKPPTALDLDELERHLSEAVAVTEPKGWHVVASGFIDAAPELLRRARQLVTAEAERDEARRERDELHTLHPRDDWHDDDGTVLWWMLPIAEQPYVGSLLDCDGVDEDYTHWSRIPNITGPEGT